MEVSFVTVVRRRSSVLLVAAAALAAALAVAPAADADPVVAAVPAAAPAAPAAVPGGTYVPLVPTRVLDTRTGLGAPRGATRTLTLQVTGRAGVPAEGVAAVVLNTTVTQPSAAGYLAVSPNGTSTSSNLNYVAGQDVAQVVMSRLSVSGRVVVTSYAATHVVADVVGYFTDAAHATGGATYRGITPSRLFDSRVPGAGGRLVAGVPRRLAVPGAPTGATAVVVDLTTVLPDTRVFVTAWGSGAQPGTSNMNVAPGDIRSNRAIVPLATDGSITVAVSNGRADVIVDVSGWFTGGAGAAGGSRFVPLEPVRVLDTRAESPVGGLYPSGWYSALSSTSLPLSGRHGLPPENALIRPTDAWLSTTVVSPAFQGWAAFGPTRGLPEDEQPLSTTSDVNFAQGATPNAVIAHLGDGGMTTITGRHHPTTNEYPIHEPDLVVDLVGVFVLTPQPASGLWRQGEHAWSDLSDTKSWNHLVPGATGDIVEVAATAWSAENAPQYDEVVALRRDGTVLIWRAGRTTPVVQATDAVHVATSETGTYVVRRDGTVWTDDSEPGSHGVPGVVNGFGKVSGVADVLTVDARRPGDIQAVRRDGALLAWGERVGAAAVVVAGMTSAVQAVAMDLYGRSCTSYRDGSLDIKAPTPRRWATLPDIGALTLTADPAMTGCYGLDTAGRVHAVLYGADGATHTVLPDVVATAIAGVDSDVMTFDGRYRPRVRALATDGAVWDWDGTQWRHVDGLDGATAIGGPITPVTWVPPAG